MPKNAPIPQHYISFKQGDDHFVVPTVVNGQRLDDSAAIEAARASSRGLGKAYLIPSHAADMVKAKNTSAQAKFKAMVKKEASKSRRQRQLEKALPQ